MIIKRVILLSENISTSDLFSVKSFSQSLFNQDFFNIVHSNLKGIKSVPTYKRMCELLQFKSTATNLKKKQFQIWSAYFKFTQNKNSFSIYSLYSEEKTKENILNILLEDSLNYLFISFLNSYYSYSHKNSIIVSNSALYEALGFINPMFKIVNPFYANTDDLNAFGAYIESQVLLSSYHKTFLTNFKKQIKEHQKNCMFFCEKTVEQETEKNFGSYQLDKYLQQQTEFYKSFSDKNNPFTFSLDNKNKFKNFAFTPTNLTLSSLNDFFSHSIPNLKYKINKLLSIMVDNSIISYQKVYVAFSKGKKFILPITKMPNILQVIQTTKHQLGVTSSSEISSNPLLRNKFFKLLQTNTFNILGYDFICSFNLFSFNPNNISFNSDYISKFLSDTNSVFFESLISNTNLRLENSVPIKDLDNPKSNSYKSMLTKKYIFSLIANTVIPNSLSMIDISLPDNNTVNNFTDNNTESNNSSDLIMKDLSIPSYWLSLFANSSDLFDDFPENFYPAIFSPSTSFLSKNTFDDNENNDEDNSVENKKNNIKEKNNNVNNIELDLIIASFIEDLLNSDFLESFIF